MKRVAIFGMGAIGSSLARTWLGRPPRHHALVAVGARPRQVDDLRRWLPAEVGITTDIDALLAARPDIVIEATGHAGIVESGEKILRSGTMLYLVSVGILADADVRRRFIAAAQAGQTKVMLPSGGLAAFDGLRALARMGLDQVTYTSLKPPEAWKDTPAEKSVDLDAIGERTVIFRGSAGDAAQLFPKNANLAAAVAIAGIGFERTQVELVVEPGLRGPQGILVARNGSTSLEMTFSGTAEAENPKSSKHVQMSVLAALDNEDASIRFC